MNCKLCNKEMILVNETSSQDVFRCDDCKLEAVIDYKWQTIKTKKDG